MKNSGNTILITGGTAGIGLEVVRQFYQLNNRLIVTSSNAENLEKLKSNFPNIQTIVCNLASENDVKALVDTCLSQYTDINILINNAGVQYNYDWKTEAEGFQKIANEIAINLTSPMQLTYGLLPILLKQKDSAIINISSGLAYAPKASAPIYCATKAAIHNGTKALRYQLAETTTKVFEIIPPLVSTAMTEGRGKSKISPQQLVDEFMKNFERDIFENNIGKTKLLRLIQRISPVLADKIMKGGL